MEFERDKTNYFLWLNGIYIRSAYASAQSDKNKYFEKPIELETRRGTETLTNEDLVEDAQRGFENMLSWAMAFNQKFGENDV